MGQGNLFLAGDIGGTKTTLTMMEADAAGALAIRRTETFTSASESSLESIIAKFLSRGRETGIQGACFGVAGAIIDGRCKTTNLPWPEMSEAGLAKAAGVPRVKLLNDLEAMAYGMLFLAPSDFVELNPSVKPGPARGHAAVIAAGTGLGEAILAWDGARHMPIASEGGHCSFAPQTELEVELWRHLRSRFSGHVSYERILSGPGFADLFAFLRQSGRFEENPALESELAACADLGERNALVSRHGLAGTDNVCKATLETFASIYGAEAGNLALKCMATGGVFIGGGIAPKIIGALKSGSFLEGFLAKGRFAGLLKTLQVRVATNPKTPVLGSGYYIFHLVNRR
jgi:glucokinase